MKNQYFGDVNDYLKYGLLRALQNGGHSRLLVAWMLTPNDGGSDGRFRDYLEKPDGWRHFDPELWDGLSHLLHSTRIPHVSLIEGTDLLPRSAFHSTVVPDGRSDRDAWRRDLMDSASKSSPDLVFFDPDNGIEIPSRPPGRKNSSKYVAWAEIEEAWAAGSSLLAYQHFPRKPRAAFIEHVLGELQRRTGASFMQAFRTSRVVFLLAAQARHEGPLRQAIAAHLPRWSGLIDVVI